MALHSLPPFRFALLLVLLSPMAVLATPREIHHTLGTTTLETPVQRLVTLYQGATDTAVALGIEPVGVVESWSEKPLYRYLRDELDDPRLLGLETQPDLEGIAWLHPDLIVGARHRHHDVYPLLSRLAPTLMQGDVFDFRGSLELMAKATGRAERGRQILSCWDARVADFRQRAAARLGDAWPPTVALLSFRGDHARIYYDGFARRVLDELGFEVPIDHQKDGWGIKLTTHESIPAMDGETVFIFMEDDPAVERTYREWTGHPLWQRLAAVRSDQVYRVDPVTWNMGGGILAANRMLDDLYRHYGLAGAPLSC
ncbi:MAG: iron-siderophore ABC transporter substrate-binding protein [Marinobacter sp.]|uniref:ABC transporter substrate-binding protein n=1 Tax=Marinobacter sp. TaxID=50741 RepID=UPI00299DC4D6|nr:iron-siderophore ABC transporter substrate-binding protein [Marinobacter sp.]MDX1635431.1 iron-siderophore ABC transporter substrate-binding protein [Marinobacter sp.]